MIKPEMTASRTLDGEARSDGLPTKELKLADGRPVTLELWLKEGQYITGEDVLSAVGVYEENYQGKYVLITRDKNGNVLDRCSATLTRPKTAI